MNKAHEMSVVIEFSSLENSIENFSNKLESEHKVGTNGHKKLFHEDLPLIRLGIYLRELDINEISLFSLPLGNEHDGIIRINDNKDISIQFTRAVDGQNENLRMELLKKQGKAPALGEIDASGTKNKRKFGENELQALEINYEEICIPMKNLMDKTYKNKKPNKNKADWLVITLDDILYAKKYENLYVELCNSFWSENQKDFKYERLFILTEPITNDDIDNFFIWDSNTNSRPIN